MAYDWPFIEPRMPHFATAPDYLNSNYLNESFSESSIQFGNFPVDLDHDQWIHFVFVNLVLLVEIVRTACPVCLPASL